MTDPEGIIGQTLAGRYEVIDFVAKGAGGSIYKGRQIGLDRTVAIKTLYAGHAEREDLRIRFEREAALSAGLNDPNTVRVYDYGTTPDGGVMYIVMEFLDGRNLYDVIKTEAPLHYRRVIHIIRQICGALSEAHEQGIVHRDMKPGNVLLIERRNDPDFVKVVDFGLVKQLDAEAQLTTPGQVLGTPSYMSPEQIRGETDIDERADIYALGSMMYVMLTRKRHLPGKDLRTMIQAHVMHEVKPFSKAFPELGIPAELEAIVLKALQRDRDDRWPSCRALGEALFELEEQWATGSMHGIGAIPVHTESASYSVPREEASGGMWLAVLVLVFVVVLAGGIAVLGGGAAMLVTMQPQAPEQTVAPGLGDVMTPAEPPAPPPEAKPAVLSQDNPPAVEEPEVQPKPKPKPALRKASSVTEGWDLVSQGDYAAAIAKFEEARAAGDRSGPVLYGLGYAKIKAGDTEGARVDLCATLRTTTDIETVREAEGILSNNELSCE